MDAADMGADMERVLLTEEQIQSRLAQMAAVIDKDYAGQQIGLVSTGRNF